VAAEGEGRRDEREKWEAMQLELYKEEVDELIKAHRSAAIRAAAAGDLGKVDHHEARVKFLIESGGYADDDPRLDPVPTWSPSDE
jgi:hypothetical protein